MGIKVVLANNGLEAFNKYSINPDNYDLIFMDIQMPVMDGIEATKEILDFEEEEEIEHIPIIALTANALKGDRERFLSEGMDEYLTKPINKEELINIIKKFSTEKIKNELLTEPTNSDTQEKEENNFELELEFENVSKHSDKNIIIAKTNGLEKKILINYLENFGYDSINTINSINELGSTIDKNKENILFIDKDFVDNYSIDKVAKAIKAQISNIKIITFDPTENNIENIDHILHSINKQTLSEIL
jgi:CheY-like chemotaxis protein